MLNWEKEYYPKDEKPLERLIDGYSFTSIFRTIAFIGDSLSSGEFETVQPDGTHKYYDMFDYSWGQFIARKNGLTAYNFSQGGMTAHKYLESFAAEKDFWNEKYASQAYVIALGVNDLYHQGYELGSLDDIDVNDPDNNKPTFLGYYGKIVSLYKKISPDAKFFFVTVPATDNNNGEARIKKTLGMVEALHGLTKIFDNSYCIDLYNNSPLYDKEFFNLGFHYGHMSPMGYVITARLIDSYIDYIIRHNPQDFKNVGFINSGIQYKF